MSTTTSTKGKVTFIRVSPSYGWGPSQDHLNTPVIFGLDAHPDTAFGFELTAGSPDLPTQLAMLAILRDAFTHNLSIGIVYIVYEFHKTGHVISLDLVSQ